MEGNVPVEPLEEGDPLPDQDWQDRVAQLVGEVETEAFGGKPTATNEPDRAVRGPQALVHELGEIAGVKLDAVARPGERARGENESRRVAIRPTQSLRFEAKRGLVDRVTRLEGTPRPPTAIEIEDAYMPPPKRPSAFWGILLGLIVCALLAAPLLYALARHS